MALSNFGDRNVVPNLVFFKGFSKDVTKEEILSIFGRYGEAKHCDLRTDASGVFLGYGTVTYESEQEAKRAIKKTNGMIVFGSQVTVKEFAEREDRDFRTVFVKNFTYDDIADEKQLRLLFELYGEITNAKVERDADGYIKGYGSVCFANAADAKKAVDRMNGHKFRSGRVLIVEKHKSKFEQKYIRKNRVSIPGSPISQLNSTNVPVTSQRANYTRNHYVRNEDNCNVFVKNFARVIEDEVDLCRLFDSFGVIANARVLRDEHNRCRGCGFVRFYSPSSAIKAIRDMNGKNYRGKVLFVGKAMNKLERQQELRRKFHFLFNQNVRPSQQPARRRQPINVQSVLNTKCNICLVENEAADSVLLNCKHVICKECIVSYVQYAVRKREVDSILCPQKDCNSELTFSLIKKLIPRDLFDEYDKCLVVNYLESCKDTLWCPKAECREPYFITPDNGPRGQCSKCSFIFCTNCGGSYHGLQPCDEFGNDIEKLEIIDRYMKGNEEEKSALVKRYTKKKLDKEMEEHLSNLSIKKECKQCPSCKTYIYKYEGCNKMLCAKCKASFCWICFKILDKTSPYAHFGVKCPQYGDR